MGFICHSKYSIAMNRVEKQKIYKTRLGQLGANISQTGHQAICYDWAFSMGPISFVT